MTFTVTYKYAYAAYNHSESCLNECRTKLKELNVKTGGHHLITKYDFNPFTRRYLNDGTVDLEINVTYGTDCREILNSKLKQTIEFFKENLHAIHGVTIVICADYLKIKETEFNIEFKRKFSFKLFNFNISNAGLTVNINSHYANTELVLITLSTIIMLIRDYRKLLHKVLVSRYVNIAPIIIKYEYDDYKIAEQKYEYREINEYTFNCRWKSYNKLYESMQTFALIRDIESKPNNYKFIYTNGPINFFKSDQNKIILLYNAKKRTLERLLEFCENKETRKYLKAQLNYIESMENENGI